jgi:ATP-dependent RNA helicase DeaD
MPQESAVLQESSSSRPTFESLGLSPVMLQALAQAGYEYPTPIQAGLIPLALQGVDVVGQARTGTGKTAAFAIPILERLARGKEAHDPQALILVPTRELAVQVRDEVVKLAAGRKVHCVAVYGGKPIRQQMEKLRRGAQIVVGTPGRVLDHLARGTINLSRLSVVVLDEADRMLDIGFRPDIERILKRCPTSRQTLLLSATVPPPIAKLAERYMRQPQTINFSPQEIAVETIEQFYFTVDPERKFDLLVRLLAREQPRQAIIFCRTKRGTEKVYQRLSKKLPDVACIHGDMPQSARDRVMAAFRGGQVRLLVATDVVGRGIDVSSISHIINYDIPTFCDDYVHRVGRTGRMGREGVAFTFVAPGEGPELTRIEQRINRLLKRDEIKDFEAQATPGLVRPSPATPLAAPAGHSPSSLGEGVAVAAAPAPTPPPPPAALLRRPPKKYRRAL